MAKNNEAADALQAIANHKQIIIDAYMIHGGVIHDTEDNHAAIKSLKKHQLVWQIDPDEPIRLIPDVSKLLSTVTRSNIRYIANSDVAEKWSAIEDAIDGYHKAGELGALADKERCANDALMHGYELIAKLKNALSDYARHINTEFTYVHNLELRAIENRKMINRASEFNDILATFDYQDLYNKAGNDDQLRRLLLKFIPMALEECRMQLGYSIDRLVKLLHTFNQQQEKLRLIDSFITHYDQNEAFLPSIDGLIEPPAVLNRAVEAVCSNYVDLNNPEHEEILEAIVERLPSTITTEKEVFEPEPVADELSEKFVELPVDPSRQAIQEVISLLSETELPLSARRIYEFKGLSAECDMELWFMALVNEIYGLPVNQRSELSVRFCEEQDEIYKGNFWVRDIFLQRNDDSEQGI